MVEAVLHNIQQDGDDLEEEVLVIIIHFRVMEGVVISLEAEVLDIKKEEMVVNGEVEVEEMVEGDLQYLLMVEMVVLLALKLQMVLILWV